MLRIVAIALLVAFAAPATSEEPAASVVLAQEKQPPHQAPKRDCEKKREEGVS